MFYTNVLHLLTFLSTENTARPKGLKITALSSFPCLRIGLTISISSRWRDSFALNLDIALPLFWFKLLLEM